MSYSLNGMRGLGQEEGEELVDVERLGPEPTGRVGVGTLVAWGSILAITGGIFYGVTRKRRVAANPRRRRRRKRRRTRRNRYRLKANRRATRRTRRGVRRRATRRRTTGALRSYKALTPAARRRMPASAFALPGKKFPIKGPPGSSSERNKWQAMQAIRYLNMGRVGTKQEYLRVRNSVIRKYGMGFWRSYDGPSWQKVQSAKRRGSATRARKRRVTRRGVRRRVAANRRTSRRRSSRRRSSRRTSRRGRRRRRRTSRR